MILLKNISYLVQDSLRVEKNADLLIDGNHIKQIGHIHLKNPQSNVEILNCRNKAVIPGFINA
ncbi:MAG: 8-oxoguanine deaminase, partial [Candidatus Pacearchaeota archaeon]|nr:8-oxoguanine deaminase [Candidatus Pacearchaeota archaeon]